jgi:hypothetical protein
MAKLVLIIGVVFVLVGTAIVAFGRSADTRLDCSKLDIAAEDLIEKRGGIANLSSGQLYGASLVMRQASRACRAERFNEARALYDLVLSLGLVACQGSGE